MKKWIAAIVVLVVAGGAGVTYYRQRKPVDASSTLITAPVVRGAVVETVQATGTLEAVTTVQVGTQVSGTLKALHADFNSQVRAGEVIAELEDSLFKAQVEQARATLVRLQADRDRAKVALEDANVKLKRAKELSSRQLLPASDYDTAEATARQAEAAVKSAEAQIVQAQAALNQNQVNLQYTIIKAPIDGVVVSRNVDVGQTVAASMQAPTLYVLAKDLTEMQVSAAIDESDIGRIHTGQGVTFKVDAYPEDTFAGTVRQVRLQPTVSQNVVSYTTIIAVPNPTLKLRPGMTANVTVEIARAENVLRLPGAATRFRPTPELFASLGQEVPPGLNGRGPRGGQGGPGGQGGAGMSGLAGGPGGGAGALPGATPGAAPSVPAAPAAASAPRGAATNASPANGAPAPGAAAQSAQAGGARPFGAMSPEERDAFRQRMQNMSPEERQKFREERMRAGGGPGGGANGGPGAGPGGGLGGPGGPMSGMSEEERQAFRQRMQAMSPEERQKFFESRRGMGGPGGPGGPGGFGRGAAAAGGRRQAQAGGRNGAPGEVGGGPVEPPKITPRMVWVLRNGKLERTLVRVSISDGTAMAVVDGALQEGDAVVTGVTLPAAQAQGAGNPLMPFGGRFPGGPGGGGQGGARQGAGAAGGGGARR